MAATQNTAKITPHIDRCDCSYCMPPSELLNSSAVRGNWATKEELLNLRIKQERDAFADLQEIVKAHNSGNLGTRAPKPSTKEVVDGILTRSKRGFVVFNILEVTIALLAWRHHLNQKIIPSLQLALFNKSILEIYATDEAKRAAKKHESKRNKRKDPGENSNAAEFERDVALLYYDKPTLNRFREAVKQNPHGTYNFEFGCAAFYPQPLDAHPSAAKNDAAVPEQRPEETTTETVAANQTPQNNVQSNLTSEIMQFRAFDARLERIEHHLGIQDGTLFIDSPSLVERLAAIEKDIQIIKAGLLKPHDHDSEPRSPFFALDDLV